MAAAFFGTLASQSQAAGESISINFGTNEPNGTISDSSSAGLEAVPGSNWNQFSGASQSTAQNLKDNNGDATGATVTWSSKNTWRGGDTPLHRGRPDAEGLPGRRQRHHHQCQRR